MHLTDCKSRTPQEALENFEEAVRQQEHYQADLQHYGESEIDISDETVEKAKEELLIWMSYIP